MRKGVQDFTRDHKQIIDGKGLSLGDAFSTKAILVGVLGLMCVVCLMLYPVSLLTSQLSYWALFLSFAMVVISLKCSLDT